MIVETLSSFIITAPVVGWSRPYPGPAWMINAELPRTVRAYDSSCSGVS